MTTAKKEDTPLDKLFIKWVKIGGIVLLALIALTVYATIMAPEKKESEPYKPGGILRAAAAACDITNPDITGATITLNGDINDTACVLQKIGTPQTVIDQIEMTRAIDGMQTVSDNGFRYQWTYHPKHGLDMSIMDNRG